jgi:hypothetical protein
LYGSFTCFTVQGGETHALKFFLKRIHSEKEAFLDGSFLPNRRDPDILQPPKSLSPDLKVKYLRNQQNLSVAALLFLK